MAKITSSPFGSISGQQLGVVGSSWKGVPYIRKHVIPKNPDTDPQKAHRGLFKSVASFGRRIVDTTLNPYTIPKPKRKSAYNVFVSRNSKKDRTSPMNYGELVLVEGSLYNPGITSVNVETPGSITVTFPTNKVGEALDSDLAEVVLYDVSTDTFAFGAATRKDGTITITAFGTYGAGQGCHAWLFFADVAKTRTSDTDYKKGTKSGS